MNNKPAENDPPESTPPPQPKTQLKDLPAKHDLKAGFDGVDGESTHKDHKGGGT